MITDISEGIVEKVRGFVKSEFEGCQDYYHNFRHSKRFVEAARKLCKGEEVTGETRNNIILAGWLHDVGAAKRYEGHVDRSMEKAEEILKDEGIPQERVEEIKNLIKATDPSREPENLPEKIMRDADASFLAKKDYIKGLKKMWKEFRDQDLFDGSLKDFYEDSLSYIDYDYFTQSGEEFWESDRRKNLQRLRERIRRSEP